MWSSPSTIRTAPDARPARIDSCSSISPIRPCISIIASVAVSGSTATSIAPSPSHLAIRIPFLEAISLTMALKVFISASAALSPITSVKLVNPDKSMNANVLSNLSSYGFSGIIGPSLKLHE